ncbi:MAG: bifunctional [glutamine synthetase] adenylyltransferase/[glutamine synthetase]-adenylyl-L-tyrosine phosphorylase, partial [Alphaproteobacteria bacterium]
MSERFLDLIKIAPIAYDSRAKEVAGERFEAALSELDRDTAELAAKLREHERARALLDGTFGNSPFLTRTILLELAWLSRAVAVPPAQCLDALVAEMSSDVARAADNAAAMKAMRIARGRVAVFVALGDLGGVFDLTFVTGALTRFADAALEAALRRLLKDAATRGQFMPRDSEKPEEGSGLILLAMGKYGALELNYSSDIDLIALYDREAMPLGEGVDAGQFAVRLIQDLTQFIQRRTEDGYVFRVDLRLRPDGNASPLALSTETAELYYESAGQNWERAALIKGRACAGDITAGERFLRSLAPYIWRKHLDYSAIEDIHSIKRQIHVHKGHGEIAILGHNVKLGRGGIREIEFFAQTQQLILGGREPELRMRGTCNALTRLAARGHISPQARDELIQSYGFLRRLEHRLQMIEDEQTHSLPKIQTGIDHVARFCGFAETKEFERVLREHMNRVQGHYARLFETSESLASQAGSLVFTGVDEDPETLETLARLGFKRGKEISATIRGWHHGRIRATRSARAREGLTRLVPIMLDALAKEPDPDAGFFEFTRFIEALPTGVQLFARLVAEPEILDLLFDLFSLAPRLSRVLAAQPAILDSLLTPDAQESETDLDAKLGREIGRAQSLEDKLDAARIFAREQQFLVAVGVLTQGMSARQAGAILTAAAEAVVRELSAVAEDEMRRRHGAIEGGEWAVIGMGKLGGREMTATSDLDLVFVYEFDPAREMSSGAKPISAGEYYARAGQRLISLLTVPTREGKLYEVDMRLRPSGRAGPVAVTLERLKTYHETQAWAFEHMALTRARFIAGSRAFGERAEAVIRQILVKQRDLAKLSADALDMRARLASAKPVTDPWSLKQVRGGLVDLEYVAQVLELALAHRFPDVLATSTAGVFDNLDRIGALPREDIDALKDSAEFYSRLSQVMQICYDEERAPDATLGVRARLASILGDESYDALEARLIETERSVYALFDKWVGKLNQQIHHCFGCTTPISGVNRAQDR